MLRALSIAVLFLSSVAFAEPAKIAIQPFKGAKASQVQTQLKKRLCKSFTCVKPGQDGEDTEVDAVVVGQVKGGKLSLSVYYDEDENPVTAKLAIKKGKLNASGINGADKAVRQAVDSRAETLAHAE
jgi:hypothetical protein